MNEGQSLPRLSYFFKNYVLAAKLTAFVSPLLLILDGYLDKRLVTTFLALLQTIITFRDRAGDLLLSELGGYGDS